MKIIFLEFDGVLNSDCYFLKRNRNMRELKLFEINPQTEKERLVQWHLYNLDLNNIKLLKEIIDETGAQIVVTSSWKNLKCFGDICKELIKIGLPIIDVTVNKGNKVEEINDYLLNNDVDNYVIISHKTFEGINSELLKHFVETNLNDSGLWEEEANMAKLILDKYERGV